MTAPVLALGDVVKSYGGKPALRGVTMTLQAGEVVGFIGPNGAGKSTCMRLLLGLTFRDGGSCQVLGMDPDHRAVEIRRRTCYLPGETSLYQHLTGDQVLRFALARYPRRNDELEREMLDRFALPLRQAVRQYSAGMKQKLALLATLVPDVDLYLLDEPDRYLDPSTQVFLRGVVQRLGQRGKTVLFSSHRLGEVEALARRLVFLLDGKVIEEERVQAARDAIRHEVCVRLVEGTELPSGAEHVVAEADGRLRVRTAEDPLRWLARLDPERVVSVEIGATHLEPLYRHLTEVGAAR